MLTGILIVFHVIACLTLILFILLQVGRGHGLSGASFGSGGVQTVFGTKTVDFLSKMTAACAIIFVITCISLDILQAKKSKSLFAPSAKADQKIDLEKLKKVLEQMKAEEAQKAPGAESSAPAQSPAGTLDAEAPVAASGEAPSAPSNS